MRFALRALGAMSLSLLSTPALANTAGITGMSNKSSGQSCNSCHLGASAPTVTLSGPTELAPGAKGEYTLTIRGGAAVVGGMNVAVDNTTAVLQPGTGSQKLGAEITHDGPQAFKDGELRFSFSLVAPTTPGTVKIYGAGNSANNNGSSDGDRGSSTTLDVTVTGDEGDDTQGGCSTTGGLPMFVLAMAAAGLPLLRRRWS
ncbi:MXAN_6652 family MXYO-CTERM-anchored protein [Melittangium boletus]|uniref:Cytochrome c domain-containing protein n=1 Tax=Melittangium boletus DSM 14713 TaxID=1294270 RepID=A0A250IK88_9BACT|nr:MXAN_6652 family MXYO-CTERM-anchored protein [Melittangium boletus]ATB31653.1 hypothetical protein MEBOL_005116 [Melittangium boletus DSM 14713]